MGSKHVWYWVDERERATLNRRGAAVRDAKVRFRRCNFCGVVCRSGIYYLQDGTREWIKLRPRPTCIEHEA